MTLVILGVISAITIPLVHANCQKLIFKARLKKAYAALTQALDNYYIDKGRKINPYWDASFDRTSLAQLLKPYLNILDDCGDTRRLNSSCVPLDGYDYDNSSNTYKTFTGNTMYLKTFDDGQYVLNDGMLVLFEDYEYEAVAGGCSDQYYYISVDVNGYGKKPNRLGRDLFMFQLTNDGDLLPMGAEGTTWY